MHTSPPSSTVATVRGKKFTTDPLYWKACLAIPAQSRWKYTIGKIILQLDQGRWNTVEMKSSTSVLSNAIPAGYYFHTMKVQQFTYKHTRLYNIYILAQIDTAIRILPPAGAFTNASSLGTARIAAHRCRLSYENCGNCAVMHRNAPSRKRLTGHGSQFNEEKLTE